jgi:hypothetical protein
MQIILVGHAQPVPVHPGEVRELRSSGRRLAEERARGHRARVPQLVSTTWSSGASTSI